MAVDTRSLVYLIDPFWQGENVNGKPLVGGYMEVYVAGTDTKYITWSDWDGARHPFRIPLKSDGRACILVEPQYTYDCYLYDSFGNLACSRLNVSPDIGGDVSVSGLTQVYHDETISGKGTPYEPLGIVSGGKTYEGIEPIVVNNDVNKISANNVALGLQEPLFFVEDSETACVIGCSAQTEIPSALSGKWDDASDVVIANSAQWVEHTEYEAGDNIDITNGVISGKDWSNEINDASANAYSQSTAWTDSQGYLTGVDLSEYAKTDFVISAIDSSTSGLLPTSAFATASGSFITALPSDLATTGWVDSQGYLTAVDIPESAVWNATTQTVSANSAQWAGGTANPQIPVTSTSGISIFESGDKVYFNISANYASENWVTSQGYLTAETDWTDTITAASANAYNEATAAIPAPFDPSYLSGQIDNKLDSAIYAADSGSFITALPQDLVYTADIQDMATTGDLTAYATVESLTAKQDAGDYLSATDSANFLLTSDSGNFYTTANESGFITGVDLTPYQLTADMTAYQPVGSYLTTADSANFYTTANESGYLTAVPDTYLQNTDLSTEDGKVTAISGIPLSAGGDVPEGVMVESGLEYNAVQEISGYNGSAIAQYGAEKQWLVHDDTLVHASNSAQYALGVNLSAVAQLLGVDETVLWSGDINANNLTGTLSEPISSFNKVKILTKINRSTQDAKQWFEFDTDREYYTILGGLTDNSDTSAGGPFHGLVMISLTGGNVKYVNGYQHMWGITGFDHKMFASIYKVIGIGRKA